VKKLSSILVAVVLLALGVIAEAQQPAKIFKIGWLNTQSTQIAQLSRSDIIENGLRPLGWVEGKDFLIEHRYADGKPDRLPDLATELVNLKVDIIVAISTASAIAAKNATKTIPIVFTSGGDPVAVGLVDSLARPGGNLTGINAMAVELAGKRLELLKETVPKLSRVAVLWNPRSSGSTQEWKESLHPARELGLQLHSMEVSSVDQFDSAFKDASNARSAALAVTSASINNSNHKRIAELAAKNRFPAISRWGEFVASGGLMSYGPHEAQRVRRVAYYMDKILRGAKPADLPVEQPMAFEMVINLKTAKALDLTIPPIVLMRATRVIK
jgi:putative tryptophan/tyrosine transport system substrate-binding protein